MHFHSQKVLTALTSTLGMHIFQDVSPKVFLLDKIQHCPFTIYPVNIVHMFKNLIQEKLEALNHHLLCASPLISKINKLLLWSSFL